MRSRGRDRDLGELRWGIGRSLDSRGDSFVLEFPYFVRAYGLRVLRKLGSSLRDSTFPSLLGGDTS